MPYIHPGASCRAAAEALRQAANALPEQQPELLKAALLKAADAYAAISTVWHGG